MTEPAAGQTKKIVSVLDIPEHLLTPGMKQYRDAKKENPDCLIMLRMGDFYEMFYEDAIAAARDLEITLTSRGKGEKAAPLSGLPYHALETYLGKLVKKGHKVAIVEQLENPKLAKGLVKRGLVRIVTPGTLIESTLLNANENNYIITIKSYGESYVYSIADLSTGELLCGQARSTESILAEIQRRNISECIVPESMMVNTELISTIRKLGSFVNKFPDYYFQFDNAKAILLEHFDVKSLTGFGLDEININKKNEISVAGALMKYLQDTQKNSLAHFKSINSINDTEIMLLDRRTLINLEISQNIRNQGKEGTLLSVLDHTVSSIGSRMLKKIIKEPLLNKQKIVQRLNSVEELNEKVIEREELRDLLKEVYDLERLIGRVNYGNANPKDLLSLKNTLQKIPLIKKIISSFNSNLLKEVSLIGSMQEQFLLLERSIKDDAPTTIREGGIIKSSFNQELKELVEIKTNSKKFLREIEDREKAKTGINALKVSFNRVFGYFIEVTKKNVHLVPKSYIRKQTTANAERYITEELKLEEEKILGAEEKIYELEFKLFQAICEELKRSTEIVQEASQKLALLDVLSSFSKVSMDNNYCKPHFNELNMIEITNGRHPVIETIEQKFISNNVKLENNEIMIITGPNTSGKSTIMRQTALIILMAQVGSFVPADNTSSHIVDQIFTRVGAQDDLSFGQSTFMVEMLETANILNNATDKSLIILDEIGRGTSTFDGVAIAWSTVEHIYKNIKAKTMFATHYHVLNKISDKFDKIKNFNVAVKEKGHEIIYLRKLIEGGTDQSHGIHVAKLAGMPSSVVDRAKEIQSVLEAEDEMVKKIKAKKEKEQLSLDGF
ncbi:DNA mismatch repair protein MutS [archaeon]|jgi:DNA mismatch repair protein MutS|nr:DNA mismatch repair protein MutS [archaeon]MBT3450746.1 DNA mismatch repair protein MutS [archaeon]MBT6868829.1 DNA mismatch repair protein MutS [archaeon]MBT7192950.1 DNA mismatch repair protein MutS [archaeon]MBT7380916.1 DNA mismatch repair protein MutS [archaeon]